MNLLQLPPSSARTWLAVLIGILLGATVSSGQGKKDAADQPVLPKAVMGSLKARFPKAQIDKQTREVEDGKEVYDVEFTQEGVKFEADIRADGSISNWEQAVPVKELPAAVTRAAGQKYPLASLKQIMAVTAVKEGKEILEGYEILLVAADHKEYEVTIAPDGKILEDSADEE